MSQMTISELKEMYDTILENNDCTPLQAAEGLEPYLGNYSLADVIGEECE